MQTLNPGEPTRTAAEPLEIRADPDLLAHTAGRLLDTALDLSARARALAGDLSVGMGGLGAPGRTLRPELRECAADIRDAVQRLATDVEADTDSLYRIAFAAQDAQRRAMARQAAATGRG